MMNLDDAQKRTVASWLAQGCKVSEIQSRLAAEFGLHLTYMEVRLLVDDLKVMPKDVEPPKPAPATLPGATPNKPTTAAPPEEDDFAEEEFPEAEEPPAGPGKATLTVDKLTRPGAMVSGSVTFGDGKSAQWYLDQFGRLGLMPKTQGYKPSPADVQAFQRELQRTLQKMGY